MAPSLSTAADTDHQHVKQLCQRLEFFAGQQLLSAHALSHGQSNQSYYVKTSQAEYVLRCYPTQQLICRQQELRVQHAAAAQGLAPAPLCLNNHHQVLISDYIADAEPFDWSQHSATLLAHLAQFHQLKVQTPLLQVTDYLAAQQQLLPAKCQPDRQWLTVLQSAATQFSALPADIVLSHMDLHSGNLLWAQNRLWLLDFEYSQLADSSLDLAALSLHFALDKAAQQQLLANYLHCRQDMTLLPELQQKLPLARQLYSGFCWLWYLAQPAYQQQAAFWQQQLRQCSGEM